MLSNESQIMLKKFSVVLVTWNGEEFLQDCLNSLSLQSLQPGNVVIIDNGSQDESVEIIKSYKNAKIIRQNSNLGVAKGWNIGACECKDSDILVFINQDVTLHRDCFHHLVSHFKTSNKIGVVGSKLNYPQSNTIQHAGGIINYPSFSTSHRGRYEKDFGQYDHQIVDVDYVTGACFAVRGDIFKIIGGVDEWFSPAYCEDVDLCLRVKNLGYQVVFNPDSKAVHSEHSSLKGKEFLRQTFKAKNRLKLAFKHLPIEDLLNEFIKEERILYDQSVYPIKDALSLAYLDQWDLSCLNTTRMNAAIKVLEELKNIVVI